MIADSYVKKNLNKDCRVNVKSVEISDELGQNLSGWQIYRSTESIGASSKIISVKNADFNVLRDPNILLGLINYGENVCFFNSVIQVLHCLPSYRDYMRPPVEDVAIKIGKRFRKIETLNESVRTSNYMRYLSLQGYEPGMQYDSHERLLQLLPKIYFSFNDDCMFKIDQLELALQ